MSNREIAETLFNIGSILDATDANPYRIRAYRRAALMILSLRFELADMVRAGFFPKIPHLGKRLTQKILELIRTGKMTFYDELCDTLPAELRQLMRVRGVGPKTALRLSRELQISTSEELLAAARAGRLQRLPGFGARREANLARAAAAVVGTRLVPIPEAPWPGPFVPTSLAVSAAQTEELVE